MKKTIIYIVLCLSFISCHLFKKIEETPRGAQGRGLTETSNDTYVFEDFPNENLESGTNYVEENFIGRTVHKRYGRVYSSEKGNFKEGKWLSGYAGFDKKGKIYAKGAIRKEEHFKRGLRDGIFKLFDTDQKVIYKTNFKMGTGLWKEIHTNGKLYFEAYTKDGYFTDTLRLYNPKGELTQKRLYKKDTLIYIIDTIWCLKFRYKPSKVKYLEIDTYKTSGLKQGELIGTIDYKTKEEYENDVFTRYTLKNL
ncbi:toxin-antitoxin system YwqK family antitoxin [Flavobacterium sp. PL002]|uniref:toxin-antitoxin system YwqK family antitoxin n=1 Tax=Flavobacterium sp. PL002 TaxID=1897058 RepID=UPI001788905C|nr:hypothetical protein [Flavobacterium sp. PL002]MBE0393074.1 hypothetical protein [Flavobacterium sp. PL002]